MLYQDVLDYIKQSRTAGISDNEIRQELLNAGWPEVDINESFNALDISVLTRLATPSVDAGYNLSRNFLSYFSKKTIALIVASTVLIGGGGVFGYFYFIQSPERILLQTFEKVKGIKALEYTGDIKVAVIGQDTSGQEKTANFSVNFNGAYDGIDAENPKTLFAVRANIDVPDPSQGKFSIGAEIRKVDKIGYLRITDLSGLPLSVESEMPIELSNLKNQWIKIDNEELQKQFEQSFSPIGEQNLSFTSEQIEKMISAVKDLKIMKVAARLSGENIDGTSTYHYKFTIDKESWNKLIIEIRKIIYSGDSTFPKDSEFFSQTDDSFNSAEGEIWIGKKDFLPRKIKFAATFRESDTDSNLEIVMSFNKFNNPPQIETPASTKTLEEVFTQLTGSTFADVQKRARDARRLADIRQIGISLELYYDDKGMSQYPSYLSDLSPKYFTTIPRDPFLDIDYVYTTKGTPPSGYCLYAVMEDNTRGNFYSTTQDFTGYDNGKIKTDCDPKT